MIPGMIPACTNCTSIYMYMYYCLRITLHWTYLWTFKFPWKSSHHINSISPTYSNTKTSQATYEQAMLIKHYMYMYLLWLGIFWVSFFFFGMEKGWYECLQFVSLDLHAFPYTVNKVYLHLVCDCLFQWQELLGRHSFPKWSGYKI